MDKNVFRSPDDKNRNKFVSLELLSFEVADALGFFSSLIDLFYYCLYSGKYHHYSVISDNHL